MIALPIPVQCTSIRLPSHVAFLAKGRLLLAAPMEELKSRIRRLDLQYEAEPPDAATLGTVLQRNGSGKHWQAVLQDLRRDAFDSLQRMDGIHEVRETTLQLEDIYCALLSGRAGEP